MTKDTQWVSLDTENDPLVLSAIDKRRFAKASIDYTFSHELIVPDRNLAIANQLIEFEDLCGLNSQAVVLNRLEHFQIPDAKPIDYCERIFKLGSRGSVLAGIRWVGGNRAKPFVSMWPNFALESSADIDQLKKIADLEFKVFSPKEFSIWLNPSSKLLAGEHLRVNSRYLVGNVHDIQTFAFPGKYQEVVLLRPESEDYYDWYAQSYQDFHALHPELKDWVPVNDREEMEESRTNELLYFVLINGQKAGLIAGLPQSLLGHAGVYFIEIMLTQPYKGRGLAAAVQRKFIDGLSPDFKLIWGTIDAGNQASSRTALRVGRRSIREEVFVKI